LMQATEQELRSSIQNRVGVAAVVPALFHAFKDVDENVRHQLRKLHAHPWIAKQVVARGFVYDVTSGLLREIVA
ncbi:MAG TPA: hypothetical protein VLV89_06765, partial [Candidatus Acidoferrum sp.]|nr:hypothetical protein [Candidatus Acidoferrum sp.]